MQPSNCLGSSPTLQPPHPHTKMPCTHRPRERLLPNSCILPTDGSATHFSLSPSHLRVAGCHSCSGKGGKDGCVCGGAGSELDLVLTYDKLVSRAMRTAQQPEGHCSSGELTRRAGPSWVTAYTSTQHHHTPGFLPPSEKAPTGPSRNDCCFF